MPTMIDRHHQQVDVDLVKRQGVSVADQRQFVPTPAGLHLVQPAGDRQVDHAVRRFHLPSCDLHRRAVSATGERGASALPRVTHVG
ncbi:MAG TPA: hypothetical protein VHR66_18475 [Gemmataceae bacterium]|nr:hypothetical protein [Gemmataceae bacterium]